MLIFDIDAVRRALEAMDSNWKEFMRVETFSAGVYRLKAGERDPQKPHTEDEIYFVSQRESHLWEDPNAPVLIRAEQTSAKSLGVDLVVYAYFAYLFTRVTHAQKVNGTGLVTPTF